MSLITAALNYEDLADVQNIRDTIRGWLTPGAIYDLRPDIYEAIKEEVCGDVEERLSDLHGFLDSAASEIGDGLDDLRTSLGGLVDVPVNELHKDQMRVIYEQIDELRNTLSRLYDEGESLLARVERELG